MVRSGGARRDEAPGEPRIEHANARGHQDGGLGAGFGARGGRQGGEIVAEGTLEQVAEEPRSYTGSYLESLLSADRVVPAPSGKKAPSSVRARERGAVG